MNMIEKDFSEREKEYFHELTTYEPFNNETMNEYKSLLQQIIHPYDF